MRGDGRCYDRVESEVVRVCWVQRRHVHPVDAVGFESGRVDRVQHRGHPVPRAGSLHEDPRGRGQADPHGAPSVALAHLLGGGVVRHGEGEDPPEAAAESVEQAKIEASSDEEAL